MHSMRLDALAGFPSLPLPALIGRLTQFMISRLETARAQFMISRLETARAQFMT